jgi:HD-GYP domain-containing protein (c-di-GMP phosphodiesterase class II)
VHAALASGLHALPHQSVQPAFKARSAGADVLGMRARAKHFAMTPSAWVVVAAFLLALVTVGVVTTLERRADESRTAQITLEQLGRDFDALQSIPYDVAYADDTAGVAAVRARMGAAQHRIETRLRRLRRDAPAAGLRRVSAPYRANTATLEQIRRVELLDGSEAESDALGLVATRQQRAVNREIDRTSTEYHARASRSLALATGGSAAAIIALIVLFATVYLRSRGAHAAAQALADENARLLVQDSQLQVVQRLALAAEYRDDDTGQHTSRVADLSVRIGAALGMPDAELRLLRHAAPLHDVGKIAIPDRILLKPGRLTALEFKQMKTHTTVGSEMLARPGFPLLEMAAQIALTHHERWDGSGYPAALAGADIPLVGRIVAVADVFDALTHERPYKDAWPLADAVAEIRAQRHCQFDPEVVDAFLAVLPELEDDAGPEPRSESAVAAVRSA